MSARFEAWKEAIREYCVENDLSFEKACSAVKSWGPQFLVLQQPKSENTVSAGLNDDAPLPIILWIEMIDGKLTFKQTEHTKSVLAN